MTLQELMDRLQALLDSGIEPSTSVEVWVNDGYIGNKIIEPAEFVSVYEECEHMGGGYFVRIMASDI